MKDFYFREPDDPNHIEDATEVSDELELLVMQIKMMLMTGKGEVLGSMGFGGDIPNHLFDLRYDPDNMMASLTHQIKTYSEIARGYNIALKLKKVPDGKYRDTGIIDVTINGKSFFGMII